MQNKLKKKKKRHYTLPPLTLPQEKIIEVKEDIRCGMIGRDIFQKHHINGKQMNQIKMLMVRDGELLPNLTPKIIGTVALQDVPELIKRQIIKLIQKASEIVDTVDIYSEEFKKLSPTQKIVCAGILYSRGTDLTRLSIPLHIVFDTEKFLISDERAREIATGILASPQMFTDRGGEIKKIEGSPLSVTIEKIEDAIIEREEIEQGEEIESEITTVEEAKESVKL